MVLPSASGIEKLGAASPTVRVISGSGRMAVVHSLVSINLDICVQWPAYAVNKYSRCTNDCRNMTSCRIREREYEKENTRKKLREREMVRKPEKQAVTETLPNAIESLSPAAQTYLLNLAESPT